MCALAKKREALRSCILNPLWCDAMFGIVLLGRESYDATDYRCAPRGVIALNNRAQNRGSPL
eukprot:3115968-Pyramimonas_sp.AAC.1